MERRGAPREPISLRVEFKTVRGLVSEYTRSLSRGGCSIRSATSAEIGTVFLMRLALEGTTRRSLEIEGKVVHSTPRKDGGFDLGIAYADARGPRQVATTRFLDQVFAEHLANRSHARMPVNLLAADADDPELKLLVHDLSQGGMGLKLPAGSAVPDRVKLGGRAEVSIFYEAEVPYVIDASVVRVAQATRATLGLRFEAVSEANRRLIDALLYLHRPDAIRIRFMA